MQLNQFKSAEAAKKLVKVWRDFVDPDARWEAEGPLLKALVDQFAKAKGVVLDTCAGIGVETMRTGQYIKDKGYDDLQVLANEVSDPFYEVLERNIESLRLKTQIGLAQVDWLQTRKEIPGICKGVKIKLALCMGNSICSMLTKRKRRDAIGQFVDVVDSDGALVIDHRNRNVIDAAAKGNPLGTQIDLFDNKEPPRPGWPMYCGKGIQTTLMGASKTNLYRYQYANPSTNDAAELTMARIDHGEIQEILRDAGIPEGGIITLGDFSHIVRSPTRVGAQDNTHFFQIIAFKRREMATAFRKQLQDSGNSILLSPTDPKK